MSKCILHIGFHKTGTTAIQKALEGYDFDGKFYPKIVKSNHSMAMYTLFTENYHLHNYWLNRGVPKAEVDKAKSRFSEKLERELAKKKTQAVFSGEDMSYFSKKDVETMRVHLEKHFSEFSIIAYVRNPYDWVPSRFQQYVKSNQADVPEWMSMNCRAVLDAYCSIFGTENVSVFEYEKAHLHENGIVAHFAEQTRLDFSKLETLVRNDANASLTENVTKLIYQFNRNCGMITGDFDIMKRKHQLYKLLSWIASNDAPISKEFFRCLVDNDDIDYLAQNWDIHYTKREVKHTRKDLEAYLGDISPDVIKLLAAFLRDQGFKADYGNDPIRMMYRIWYHLLEASAIRSASLAEYFRIRSNKAFQATRRDP